MTFLHPQFLYLMLPPVLILFYFILTQKDPVAGFFDPALLKRLRVNEKRLTLRQRNAIYLAIFILLILAMAQPVIVEEKIRVKPPERDLMIALDISASMHTHDIYPDRLDAARAKALSLVDFADEERIGIMAFGRDVYLVVPPTRDKTALKASLKHLDVAALSERGSDMGALVRGARTLMKKMAEKNLVILTDGGEEKDFDDIASFARRHHIRLFILGMGTRRGGPVLQNGKPLLKEGEPVISRLNPALAKLAAATGGAYLQAQRGTEDVLRLLHRIRTHSKLHRGDTMQIERYGQLFILPLGLALFLLLLATSSMSRRETVDVPPLFLLGVFLCALAHPARADLMDYELLEQAKTLYSQKEYGRAANAYYRYGKDNGNDARAMYNSAHALYRMGNYEAAAALWAQIHSPERIVQFRTLYNLGNANAMIGDELHLKAAIRAYEKALHLQNDRETRENLERVRGKLMRMMQAKFRRQKDLSADAASAGSLQKAMPSQQMNGSRSAAQTQYPPKRTLPSVKSTVSGQHPEGMSDFEARMWFKTLQRKGTVHLYKIAVPEKHTKRGDDVNPW